MRGRWGILPWKVTNLWVFCLFVFSPNLEMLSLHREEEQRQIILVVVMDEDGVYLYIDLSE